MSRNGRAMYPWDKWFRDGWKTLTLVKGKHFDCQIHGMIGQIRNVLSARGVSAKIRATDNKIVVTEV